MEEPLVDRMSTFEHLFAGIGGAVSTVIVREVSFVKTFESTKKSGLSQEQCLDKSRERSCGECHFCL